MVPTGTSRSFDVGYRPSGLGTDVGLTEVAVDGLPFPLVVPVLGEGSRDPRVRERFAQPPREDVDVLFVIDDSCSMAGEQRAIARNFRSFIQQADLRRVDFRIGVTTTTVLGTAGALEGPPLTPTTVALEQAFARQTGVGIRGSGIELGLEAALGAVRRAEQGLSPNRQLFRTGSQKVFVIVSDEDDQSQLSPLAYAAELERRFSSLTAAVISGGATGCRSSTGSAVPAPRYQRFIGQLNGITTSICADWGQTLSTIGQAAFGLKTRFRLSRRADPTQPVGVWIDGQAVPASRHRLDGAGAAVIIEPPPPEGAQIEVEFTPAC
jgi:hypothetical protein